MQKIIYLGVLLLIVSSCSVLKHKIGGDNASSEIYENNGKLENLYAKNLTRNSFYIKSVDIEYNEGNNKSIISGSIKFEKPDKYLIALRSRAGIEFVRIFINRDSVYIMDRLNKKVFGGPLSYIRRKYGFPAEILPVFLGDIVGSYSSDNLESASENRKFLNSNIAGVSIKYEIDRFVKKAAGVIPGEKGNLDFGELSFSKFVSVNETTYPSKIIYINEFIKISAELKIRKIEFPWNETIEFKISDRYKIFQLL